MAEDHHLGNRFIAIFRWNGLKFWSDILYAKVDKNLTKMYWTKFKVLNSRWRTDTILENVGFEHNSAVDCLIFKRCTMTQNPTWHGWVPPFQTLKIQNGGRPPSWKSLYCHNLVKGNLILMKFCMLYHWDFNKACITKPKILKPDMAFGKYIFGYSSTRVYFEWHERMNERLMVL